MREADAQPSVKVLIRADPIVHYTIKFTVNRHEEWEFPPGTPVECEPETRSGQDVQVAKRRASTV